MAGRIRGGATRAGLARRRGAVHCWPLCMLQPRSLTLPTAGFTPRTSCLEAYQSHPTPPPSRRTPEWWTHPIGFLSYDNDVPEARWRPLAR